MRFVQRDRGTRRAAALKALLAAGLVVGTLGATPPPGAAVGVPARAEAERPLVAIGSHVASVSPNGDGFRERLRLPLTLSRKAFVDIRLRNLDIDRTVRGGRLVLNGSSYIPRGRHVLGLRDLTRQRPGSLPAGRYALRLTASWGQEVRPQTVRTRFTVLSGPISLDSRSGSPLGELSFSPNGDGVRDQARVSFALERRSRVTASVGGGRTVRLGTLPAGRHRWSWSGTARGRTVADGAYALTLQARPVAAPRRPGTLRVTTVVDRTAPDPAVVLNRSTVYPAAAVIEDSLRVGLDLPPEEVASAQVRTSAGSVVGRLVPVVHECAWGYGGSPGEETPCALLTWDAQTPSGPVPGGAYVLRIQLTDAAGNSRVVRRPVTVSAGQLVERTGSVSWNAADAPRWNDPCWANGCYDQRPCASHPSQRFAGGVSFRSGPEECSGPSALPSSASYGFRPDVTSGTTPFDRFRITATGGPTTPGDDDTGVLSARGPGQRAEVVLSGDSTATTDWAPMLPDVELFAQTDVRARWSAGALQPMRYDVASYTLEYTYYVPAG